MLVIGLTGGIGSGKTTVADYFSQLGIDVIDADILARNIVTPGSEALLAIVKYFGSDIVDENKLLQRSKLRKIIFNDSKARKWLENLLHPLVRRGMAEQIAQVKSPYCLLVIPLLIESSPNPLLNRILVIDAPEHLQIVRTQKRDNLTVKEVEAIIKAQASRAVRLAKAQDIIHNYGDLENLKQQAIDLHKRYLQLAAENIADG